MTRAQRLQAALRILRWTYGTLAVELGLSPSTTRNWGLGRSPVPENILEALERLAALHLSNPLPGARGSLVITASLIVAE